MGHDTSCVIMNQYRANSFFKMMIYKNGISGVIMHNNVLSDNESPAQTMNHRAW